jgi:hypothetical protein
VFEAAEAAFHDVSGLVDVGVEDGWASAGAAFGCSAGDLIAAFGDGVADAATS